MNPKFPDFKCKVGDRALWLNGAPAWVLSELEGVEFDVKNLKLKQQKGSHGKGLLFTIPLLCIENTIGRGGFRLDYLPNAAGNKIASMLDCGD